jgi:hypothetical protein
MTLSVACLWNRGPCGGRREVGPRLNGRAVDALRRCAAAWFVAALALAMPPTADAQNAELSGFVRDTQGRAVPDVDLTLIDRSTGVSARSQTNDRGIYTFVSVKPGVYDLKVAASGFTPTSKTGLSLNVGERAGLDVVLTVGGQTEEITVVARDTILRSTDGSVSTVLDRKFAENLPINGRTFGALLALAPGVTPAATNLDGGQYSVNGQRAASNYLTVDGVSATSGSGRSLQNTAAGQLPSSTITGGLSGLISLDALQEIRIQTSTFSPEFGRTPGAQISLVTRSGTNTLHGSAFEQFRDESLAANNWFLNRNGIAKAQLRQHQFGGTAGGPLLPNRSFFFGSYEGLRLLQPRTLTTGVPSLQARQQPGPLQAVFEMYPQPTGPNRADGSAEYITAISTRTTTDTYGLRVDHTIRAGTQAFVRYSHAPSTSTDNRVLYLIDPQSTSRNVTGGLTTLLGSKLLADVRFMYGKDQFFDHHTDQTSRLRSLYPTVAPETSWLQFNIGNTSLIQDGTLGVNENSQWNVVGSLSYVFGNHHVKTGLDYRRTSPLVEAAEERFTAQFQNVNQALTGVATALTIQQAFPFRGHFDNVSMFAQDTWKANQQLSLSYGLRWDINPAPSFRDGEGPFAAVTGASAADLGLVLQRNVPLWKTSYRDIAPRVGFSYAVDPGARWILSGGVGVFGDLSGQAAGLAFSSFSFPNGTSIRRTNAALPFSPAVLQSPGEPVLVPPFTQQIGAIDPLLRMPRTTQWNLTVERALGAQQSVSVAYVGARGTRLLQTAAYFNPNPSYRDRFFLTSSDGRSQYRSLQIEYRRRASKGLQVLSSYTLGRAEDTASATFAEVPADAALATADLDIRHVFNAAVSWDLPSVGTGPLSWVLRDWGVHVIGTARSGAPFSVIYTDVTLPGEVTFPRASVVPGQPLVIDDPVAPHGQRFNPAAFTAPSAGQNGTSPRNGYRGFAAYQVDMGIQRTISVFAGARVRVRADVFNVLNTPNFGLPVTFLSNAQFGRPTATLNESGSFGAVNGLYRQGGPRMAELSLRVDF